MFIKPVKHTTFSFALGGVLVSEPCWTFASYTSCYGQKSSIWANENLSCVPSTLLARSLLFVMASTCALIHHVSARLRGHSLIINVPNKTAIRLSHGVHTGQGPLLKKTALPRRVKSGVNCSEGTGDLIKTLFLVWETLFLKIQKGIFHIICLRNINKLSLIFSLYFWTCQVMLYEITHFTH